MFVIESDATIVAPLILSALLECQQSQKAANALIKQSRIEQKQSRAHSGR